jgi:glucose/arabinose dehydrogenase
MTHRTAGGRRSAAAHRPLAFESLEPRQLLAATPIGVHVAGNTGTEQFQLQIDGVAVATWTNTRVLTASRVFDTFTYTHPTDVAINRIRVALVNDGAGGVDRNLYVDGIAVNGAKYESEASTVYSTGTYDSATNGRLPGFRKTEALHYNGYFEFGAAKSTIQILAAGSTRTEQMHLLLSGNAVATFNNVAGTYASGQFATYSFNAAAALPINQIRVAFANDGTNAGADRNLRVDAVILDGVRYETEAASVFSTGTVVGGSRSIGRNNSEYLHLNGYFQYGAAGTVIEVLAAGRTHEEQMQLQINGQAVATFDAIGGDYLSRQFQLYIYVAPTAVPLSHIRVAYTNDATTAAGDRNLRVDAILRDGVTNQAEAADVYSTGTYVAEVGAMPGLWQTEYLHVNGYLQFASGVVPGSLALGTTLISVNEGAGTVSIPVTRTGGSGGTVGVRYTTVNATAIAGSDYTGASAKLLVFGPGETTKNIVVPITNDTGNEGSETFNVAVDQAIGGANVSAPRTATITIIDNDGPAPIGTGNGLLGTYFPNVNLVSPAFARTDATVNFDFGEGSPGSSIPADYFSIRWTGQVEPRYTETYTFRTTTDDGVRLWVNGQLIIDSWIAQPVTDRTGTITLQAGQKYSIQMDYYEEQIGAVAKLSWSSSSQPLQIIPQAQLYSDPPPPSETGTFSGQTIISGLSTPTAMDFDSSGRMFVSEQRGVVRVYQNGQLLATPFLDIQNQVNFVQDRGLLGVAVHPNFPATPYVYVSYTYDPPETANNTGLAGRDGSGNRVARVSRFTANSATGYNTAVAGSEVVLVGTNSTWSNISSPNQDSTDNMTLPPSGGLNGTLRDILIADSRSHTVGNLAFGPDGKLYVANGDGTSFGRVDPRTARVQNLDSLSGKILRVDPITGQGLSDNPFYNGDPNSNRAKVYNYGLRNPFRFAFQPGTGTLFVGDVGWNTWEEINSGRGENFGWPYYEGASGTSARTGGYQDLAEAQAFYATNPDVQAPLWARAHSSGSVAIVAGDFYTGTTYPTSYRGAMFLSDFGDNQLRVLRLNSNGTLNSVTAMGLSVGGVVEMTMGRDGMMYYVDLVNGRVGRLVFTPSAAVVAAPDAGDFDSDSFVNGNDFLAWQRGLGAVRTADELSEWRARFVTPSMESTGVATSPSLVVELGGAPLLADGDGGDEAAYVVVEPGAAFVVSGVDRESDDSPFVPSEPVNSVLTKESDEAMDELVWAAFGEEPFAWLNQLL